MAYLSHKEPKEHMNQEVRCNNCKNTHLIEAHDAGMRDADSLNCPDCKSELLSWNGSTYYTLVKTATKPDHHR